MHLSHLFSDKTFCYTVAIKKQIRYSLSQGEAKKDEKKYVGIVAVSEDKTHIDHEKGIL